MERAFVAVERDSEGWPVDMGGQVFARGLDKFSAMQRAGHIARECHRSLGIPTGVLLRMGCGRSVMIGRHG